MVGVLYSVEALGALLVALVSGQSKYVRRQGLVTLVACVCWGAGIIGFGLAGTLWVALVFLMLASASDMVSGLYRDAILKTVTPDEMRGRLRGSGWRWWGRPVLGNAEAGLLASVTSVQELDRVRWRREHHRRRHPRLHLSQYRRYDGAEEVPRGSGEDGRRVGTMPRSEDHNATGASVRAAREINTRS